MTERAERRYDDVACKVVATPVAGQSPVEAGNIDADDEKRPLFCKICGTLITYRSLAIAMNGGHVHVFSNPAGLTFEIGCFSRAPGCAITGAPTAEHTWFPGYAWSFALCGGCFNHLGWRYAAGSSGFFGLILAMLTEQ